MLHRNLGKQATIELATTVQAIAEIEIAQVGAPTLTGAPLTRVAGRFGVGQTQNASALCCCGVVRRVTMVLQRVIHALQERVDSDDSLLREPSSSFVVCLVTVGDAVMRANDVLYKLYISAGRYGTAMRYKANELRATGAGARARWQRARRSAAPRQRRA